MEGYFYTAVAIPVSSPGLYGAAMKLQKWQQARQNCNLPNLQAEPTQMTISSSLQHKVYLWNSTMENHELHSHAVEIEENNSP